MNSALNTSVPGWADYLAYLGVRDPKFDETGTLELAIGGRLRLLCRLNGEHLVLTARIGSLAGVAPSQREDVLARVLQLCGHHLYERLESPALSADGTTLTLQRWLASPELDKDGFVDAFSTFIDAVLTWRDWWKRISGTWPEYNSNPNMQSTRLMKGA